LPSLSFHRVFHHSTNYHSLSRHLKQINKATHTGFRLSTVTGDQQYIKASTKYFSVALFGGGGQIYVGRHDRPGRFQPGHTPTLHGHSGAILDFEWNPFDESMLATASEDTMIKLWSIPNDWEPIDDKGMSKSGNDITDSLVDLVGHAKKVNLLRFHPTASNVLMSTSSDYTVKIWDVETATDMSTFSDMQDLCQDIVWDYKGDHYATSCKDKAVRFVDARTASLTGKIEQAHDGVKGVKVLYMGESGKVLTTGHSRQSGREVKIWDLSNLSKPIHVEKIDNAAGVLMPMYDVDTNVIYLCGKGDGNIRTCEFEDKEPYFHKLNDGFRSTTALKGVCMVPKRGLDIMGCESARLLKVTNEAGVQPLSFYVPRKSDAFQEDIFPETASAIPAHTAEEWMGGSSKAPETMSLNPKVASQNGGGAPKKKFSTVSSLTAELKDANKRIKYLEEKLAAAGISCD
jgi:coronin-1B/1C/6